MTSTASEQPSRDQLAADYAKARAARAEWRNLSPAERDKRTTAAWDEYFRLNSEDITAAWDEYFRLNSEDITAPPA